MPLLSVWIGYREPIMTLWLKCSIPRLLIVKSTGMPSMIRYEFSYRCHFFPTTDVSIGRRL